MKPLYGVKKIDRVWRVLDARTGEVADKVGQPTMGLALELARLMNKGMTLIEAIYVQIGTHLHTPSRNP